MNHEQINVIVEEKVEEENSHCRKDQVSWLGRMWVLFRPSSLCPESNLAIKGGQVLVASLLFGLATFLLLGKSATPLSGPLFQFACLTFVALALGKLFDLIDLPPLIGMLLAGILVKELGIFNIGPQFQGEILILRKISMTVILIKAGLNLNPEAMQRLSCLVVRLAFTPCCVEAVSVMLAAHFILKVPLVWGLLMGFVIGAVSPAILVPSLLKLQKAGFGGQSGIHTLGIAASTIDDILAISAFGIISGLIFEHGTLVGDLIKGPVEVVLGISAGVLFGLLTIYLPHGSDKNVVPLRVFLLFSGGISFLFGAHRLGYEGAGPLACMISSFVASCGWNLSDDDPKVVQEVTRAFSGIWFVFEPILFSLIGADIQLSHLTMEMLGKSLAVLGLALLMRFAAAYLVTFGGVFQKKERLFLAIAWMPKASVQGLLGPIALEMATQAADQTAMIYGEYILTVAVLSILLTAPAGAIAIKLAGSRLLQKS